MDAIVEQAMRKWPNVPHCYGWLGLDQRGQWWLRDLAAQAAGDFAHSKGSRLEHTQLIGFIERNYAADAQGCWFFQNGPQRVFVELENTPLVWRVQADGQVHSPTGASARPQQCLVDENGLLYAASAAGLGLVHTQDMWLAAELLEQGRWPAPQIVAWAGLPQQFGFVRSPQLQAPVGAE